MRISPDSHFARRTGGHSAAETCRNKPPTVYKQMLNPQLVTIIILQFLERSPYQTLGSASLLTIDAVGYDHFTGVEAEARGGEQPARDH